MLELPGRWLNGPDLPPEEASDAAIGFSFLLAQLSDRFCRFAVADLDRPVHFPIGLLRASTRGCPKLLLAE
ncbi:MAG: hypothetical protein V2J51_06820 [Erythrobacter sp.]|nr:hypothetical protein [Erythrobacter sp.]